MSGKNANPPGKSLDARAFARRCRLLNSNIFNLCAKNS
nr:MAG TPA: hypothetical protein [Caudoviricetes sp.]